MTEAVTTATATLGVDLGGVLELDEGGESLSLGRPASGSPCGSIGAHPVHAR